MRSKHIVGLVTLLIVGAAILASLEIFKSTVKEPPVRVEAVTEDRIPPSAVPSYVQPRTTTALQDLLDRSKNSMERVPADTSNAFTALTPIDERLVLAALADPTDEDTARNEMINLLRRAKSKELPGALTGVLKNNAESPRFKAFAAQHLGSMLNESGFESAHAIILPSLKSALNDADTQVQREALLALVRKQDVDALKRVNGILSGEIAGDGLVDLAIHCIHEQNNRDSIPAIRQHVRSENTISRIAAIVVLSDWGDEASRYAFEEAAKSKNKRLQRAGEAALLKLGPIAKASTPSPSALIEGLLSHDRSLRLKAAQQVILVGTAGHGALPGLIEAMQRLDRTSPIEEIGLYLEAIRSMGKEGADAAQTLASLLPERAAIFKERTKEDLHTIRGLVILTLAETFQADAGQLAILDYLANSDRDLALQYAISARAAQGLADGKTTVPFLLRALEKDFPEKRVIIPTYVPERKGVLTSGRLEVLRTLKKLGKKASEAVPRLVEFVEFSKKTRPDLSREAEEALAAIKKDL
jgi:HEAT repeat protein